MRKLIPLSRPAELIAPDEQWRWVVGYEQLYSVSSYGRVMGKRRIRVSQVDRGGYPRMMLSKVGMQKLAYVHRLVAQAFIEQPNGCEVVNHKDGNKLNCHVGNLEWCTDSYNCRHARALGLTPNIRGADHPHAKLTEAEVREFISIFRKGVKMRLYADRYGVDPETLRDIIAGRTWRHISRKREDAA